MHYMREAGRRKIEITDIPGKQRYRLVGSQVREPAGKRLRIAGQHRGANADFQPCIRPGQRFEQPEAEEAGAEAARASEEAQRKADEAIRAAREAADAARRAAEDAMMRAGEANAIAKEARDIGLAAREAAEAAANIAKEAATLAEGAMPKALIRKILSSWDFLFFILAVLLASIFSAVAISVGLSLFPH